ncbi:hypothetical protein [Zooshikella harenae]|uniref:Lipocalin-like domain-containing protein n=1 Tax=Zooshikella harenae TaxID=2827238 RepID=A0ABS5ZKC3_9GAMM|nr:hypothetical protein [Zooshikella harenae]MBU2714531.1 hypothetical protein [Zooshikella harenae]
MFSFPNKPKLVGVRPEARAADYPEPEQNESGPFLGKWAVLNYYVPDNLMHPDDAERYLEGKVEGERLFQCTSEDVSWATVTNDQGVSVRVNPHRVLWVPQPEYKLGQDVKTTNGTIRTGKIASRVWHFKEKRFTYYIEIDGKNNQKVIHKRRYWANDLTSTRS